MDFVIHPQQYKHYIAQLIRMLAVWISDPLISSSQGCPCCLHYSGFTIRQLYFQHPFSTLMLPLSSHSVQLFAPKCTVVLVILEWRAWEGKEGSGELKCDLFSSLPFQSMLPQNQRNDRGSGRQQIINVLKKWLCGVGRLYVLTGNEAKRKRDKIIKSYVRVQQATTEPPCRAAVTELSLGWW